MRRRLRGAIDQVAWGICRSQRLCSVETGRRADQKLRVVKQQNEDDSRENERAHGNNIEDLIVMVPNGCFLHRYYQIDRSHSGPLQLA